MSFVLKASSLLATTLCKYFQHCWLIGAKTKTMSAPKLPWPGSPVPWHSGLSLFCMHVPRYSICSHVIAFAMVPHLSFTVLYATYLHWYTIHLQVLCLRSVLKTLQSSACIHCGLEPAAGACIQCGLLAAVLCLHSLWLVACSATR